MKNILKKVQTEDLLKFGMIPEFIGRLPVMSVLEELDEETLISILTLPKNAIVKQFKTLVRIEGAELTFTNEALLAIARKALASKTGARGLRAIIEELLLDTMFDLPTEGQVKEVIVDEECITKAKPVRVVQQKEAMAG